MLWMYLPTDPYVPLPSYFYKVKSDSFGEGVVKWRGNSMLILVVGRN